MARVKVDKAAVEEAKAGGLMRTGRQILEIVEVAEKPKARPKYIAVKCKNAHGESITNRWDITSDKQVGYFGLFYYDGCGCDDDDEGYAVPKDMLHKFADVTIKHTELEARDVVDEETGEITTYPARTFANFAYIHGNAAGFDDAEGVETESSDEELDDEAEEDDEETDFD